MEKLNLIHKSTGRKSFLAGIPSWAVAFIAMFIIFMILMVIGEGIKTETIAAEILVYIIWGIDAGRKNKFFAVNA